MATPSDNRLMSALDGIIKEEVASALRSLSIDDMVEAILRRPDHQAIYDKLFNRLYGGSISRMIGTRGDTRKIYQDLFGELIAKMEIQSQGQQEQHESAVESTDKQTPIDAKPSIQIDVENTQIPSSNESAPGSRPQALESRHQPLPPGSYSPEVGPAARSGVIAMPPKEDIGTTGASREDIHSIGFGPLEPGLDAWAPMFTSEAELRNIGPRVNEIHTTPRSYKVARGFYDFIECLNPAYLSGRAEYLTKRFPRTLRLENTRELVTSWHAVGEGYSDEVNDISIAFMAVRCFDLYQKTHNTIFLRSRVSDEDEELETFTDYAESERDIRKGSVILKKDKTKWRDIMRLGGQLSSLLKDFGGESFLILFPLHELSDKIGESLVSIHSIQYPWNMIRSLLEHTGLGDFFRSLSGAVGDLLISRFRTQDDPKGSFMEHIAPVFEKYYLKGITKNTPRPEDYIRYRPVSM